MIVQKIEQLFKKLNNSGEHFSFAVNLVATIIAVSLFAFMTESNKATGYSISNLAEKQVDEKNIGYNSGLMEFKDVNSLATLAAGTYYIGNDGIVYWFDDDSKLAMAKVKIVDEAQKNRLIYIDDRGNIGYVLNEAINK